MNIHFKTYFPWPGADGQPEPTHFGLQIMNAFAPNIFSPSRPGNVQGKKLHTIRRLPNNGRPRYREGMRLVMCMGSRYEPQPFLEAECTGVQLLQMDMGEFAGGLSLGVRLVEHGSYCKPMDLTMIDKLAANDGLSREQFLKWFLADVIHCGPGTYQVVHWTKHRY